MARTGLGAIAFTGRTGAKREPEQECRTGEGKQPLQISRQRTPSCGQQKAGSFGRHREYDAVRRLVEIGGFEPPTSAMRTQRSPS